MQSSHEIINYLFQYPFVSKVFFFVELSSIERIINNVRSINVYYLCKRFNMRKIAYVPICTNALELVF